jgi:hypothetical protein
MRTILLWIVTGCCVLASAQDTTGWKTITDKVAALGPDALCQVMAPADWMPRNRGIDVDGNAAEIKAYISVVSSQNTTFDQTKLVWTRYMRIPTQVFEDSPKRLWYEHDPKGSVVENGRTYKKDWIVVIASKVPCVAEIAFNDSALAAKAKIVVNSLKPLR